MEIAFESDPADTTQVWTDVSQDVVSFSTRRGRQDELGRVEAGTASFTFLNWERRYDPELNAGANLVTNPWLETDTTGWSGSAGMTLTRSSDQQATGTHSLKCENTSGTGPSFALDGLSVTASTDYYAGMRVYVPSGYPAAAPLYVGAASFDAGSGPSSEVGHAFLDMGLRDEWQWATFFFRTVTDVAGFLVLRENGTLGSGDGSTVYVDHAFVIPSPASPFTGNLQPMKRIRVRARFGGTEYDVWHGLITGWGNRWLGTGGIPHVEIQAVDLFKIMALSEFSFNELGGTSTGNYISDRLDQVSWPGFGTLTGQDRALDEGTHFVGAQESAVRNMLSSIQDAATSEGGVFFAAGNGEATFLDRLHRLEDSTASSAVFSDLLAAQDAPNNGFDSGIDGWSADGAGVTVSWDPDVDRLDRAWSGSAYVETPGSSGSEGLRENTNGQRHQCAQGDVIHVEVWVLPDGYTGDFNLQVHEYNGVTYTGTSGSIVGPYNARDGVWTRLVYPTYSVANASTDRVRVDVDGAELVARDFWVDDVVVQLERADNVIGYTSLEPEYDDSRLVNDSQVTWSGGTEQVEDSTSQTAYMVRTRATTTILSTGGFAAGLAASEIHRYKDPQTRFPSIEVETADDGDTAIADILGLEIWDRVTVRRTPPEGGEPIVVEEHVEGISHDVSLYNWRTRFDLSPADPVPGSGFLELDDATAGRLGSGNYYAP